MNSFKITALITGGLLTIVLTWYLSSRIKTVSSPISVYSIKQLYKTEGPHGTRRLKVASFNIAHGRGGKLGAKNRSHKTRTDLLEHLDRISEQIKTENPDFIVLNETDFSSDWSFNINQAEYIAKKCGYPYLLEQLNMGVSFPFYHLYFGNALLSKFPIQHPKFIDLEPYSKLEDMVVGNHDAFYYELKIPSGPIGILGIHFEYRSETIRVRSAEMLAEMMSEIAYPVIVIGDFNSTPSGLSKSELSENGKNAMSFLFKEKGFMSFLNIKNDQKHYTFPSEKPDRRIDWILGRGIDKFINSRIIQSELSDHFMIVTEAEI